MKWEAAVFGGVLALTVLGAGAAEAGSRSPLGQSLGRAFGDVATAEARAATKIAPTPGNRSAGVAGDPAYRAPPGARQANGSPAKRVEPNPAAKGDHTVWLSTNTKGVTNYATYRANPRNPTGFDTHQRVDLVGDPHFNKKIGRYIATPHVHSRQTPGGVRPVLFPHERPKSAR